jgi:hypothetical protein
MHIVYKTVNKVNCKYYIGVQNTDDPSYLGSGISLKKAIKKYGKDNFTKETLFECTSKEEAFELESKIVTQELVNDPQCYNMTVGGKIPPSNKGIKMPPRDSKYINKQRKAKLGAKNPRHYRTWTTPWGSFDSLNQAASACEDYITGTAIKLFCTSKNNQVINGLSVARSKGYLKLEFIGLTYNQLGFK